MAHAIQNMSYLYSTLTHFRTEKLQHGILESIWKANPVITRAFSRLPIPLKWTCMADDAPKNLLKKRMTPLDILGVVIQIIEM